ncbi:MAG: endonuclease III [Deltaproteobacteria bacterium]|nr:endonuclease III [Deltaproteobacteria bacterium]
MDDQQIDIVVRILKKEVKQWKVPIVGVVAEKTRDPFQILISCVLSLRTQDGTTAAASERLFAVANTPETLAKVPVKKIEKLIYPVGFYRVKAKNIRAISKRLIDDFASRVPDTIEELLTLPGVGRKTANLVVTIGYGKYGICVDTHVHRITNRWGYVSTATPEKTEFALREKLPKKHWKVINDLLVTYGQNLCRPIGPKCGACRLYDYCDRVGVEEK